MQNGVSTNQVIKQIGNSQVGTNFKSGVISEVPGIKCLIAFNIDFSQVTKKDVIKFAKNLFTQVNMSKLLGVSQSYISKKIR